MSIRAVFAIVAWAMLLVLFAVVVIGRMAGGSAQDVDVLRRYYGDDPDTLNMLTATDSVSTEFQAYVYEGLATRSFPDPDTWIPVLATGWEFDKEKLEYTIHLRKGVKWHAMQLPNGQWLPETEFTARDVKFTFDCILNPNIEATALRSYYEDPEAEDASKKYKISVEVVDQYTVKIRWTKPYFMSKTWTVGIPMIPRHVYSVDENGEPISFDFSLKEFADGFNNHWANTRMCGTGPMRFQEWKRGQRFVLVRNPDYWNQESAFHFRRIVFQRIANTNTVVQKLLQNDLDYAPIPEKDQFVQLKEHPNVTAGKVKLAEFVYPGYRYIGYNMNREFFKQREVRWALSHAVPVQTIIDKVFYGLAVPTSGPFFVESTAYNKACTPVPYDLEEAKRLLEGAGWADTDGDGVRDKRIDNVKIPARYELMIYADSPTYLTIAGIVKENSRKIGVDVQIAPAKWALMLQKLRQKEFDATMLGWTLPWKGDPFQLWHSSQADLPDSSNAIGYRNPQVDKLIEALRVELDEAEQIKKYHQIHKLLYDDQPYTFLYADKRTAGYDARIQNIRFYRLRPCIDPQEWYATEGPARGY